MTRDEIMAAIGQFGGAGGHWVPFVHVNDEHEDGVVSSSGLGRASRPDDRFDLTGPAGLDCAREGPPWGRDSRGVCSAVTGEANHRDGRGTG